MLVPAIVTIAVGAVMMIRHGTAALHLLIDGVDTWAEAAALGRHSAAYLIGLAVAMSGLYTAI